MRFKKKILVVSTYRWTKRRLKGWHSYHLRQREKLWLGQVEKRAHRNRRKKGWWAQSFQLQKSLWLLQCETFLYNEKAADNQEAKQNARRHQNKQHFLFLWVSGGSKAARIASSNTFFSPRYRKRQRKEKHTDTYSVRWRLEPKAVSKRQVKVFLALLLKGWQTCRV